ncbi:TadE/TadG family type IV pilus assembly protein [Nocardiopsis deserti]|uniref:TadE/TadG family type IV pilus assembly protein n=1 Tax=Nocardiopsis deserti TaxID=2605988 RepID=UPI001CC25F72|nr:TadE/TadG family type IV pilus assembly protein [Nocardiopsis deserti]
MTAPHERIRDRNPRREQDRAGDLKREQDRAGDLKREQDRERSRKRERDRGSASVELVLIIPVVLAFLLLLALTGRNYTAALAADALAHAAARSASLHTDRNEARNAAEQAVAESVGGWGRACQEPAVRLRPTTEGNLRAMRAEVECTVHRDDLRVLEVSERRTVTGSAVSVLDVHREREP